MKRVTNNIKDLKVKKYFENVTDGRLNTTELSALEYENGISQFLDGLDKVVKDGEELVVRTKLGDVPEAISFSYIAKRYFGKSRAWLMQKVNGNLVNGKQASFTPEERKQFREALQDISKKLNSAALSF